MTVTIQGNRIEGGGDIGGTNGQIPLFGFESGFTAGFDQLGHAGVRTLEPFTLHKGVDQASPHLWNALVNGQSLALKIEFWEQRLGAEQLQYELDLEGVLLTRIDYEMQDVLPDVSTFDAATIYRHSDARTRRDREVYVRGISRHDAPARERAVLNAPQAREVIRGTCVTLRRTWHGGQGNSVHSATPAT